MEAMLLRIRAQRVGHALSVYSGPATQAFAAFSTATAQEKAESVAVRKFRDPSPISFTYSVSTKAANISAKTAPNGATRMSVLFDGGILRRVPLLAISERFCPAAVPVVDSSEDNLGAPAPSWVPRWWDAMGSGRIPAGDVVKGVREFRGLRSERTGVVLVGRLRSKEVNRFKQP